ncbi:MAG: hypothetical protein JRF70_17055 [Deltaproteobacteria bacterium]|nr:hypothetical protein [Deltaproteobacteria bacterium]
MADKYCFMNRERVCDLTCKAAFPVDDAVDPVDCYFIWLSANLGEGLFDLRRMLEGGLPSGFPPNFPGGGGGPGEAKPPGGDLSKN